MQGLKPKRSFFSLFRVGEFFPLRGLAAENLADQSYFQPYLLGRRPMVSGEFSLPRMEVFHEIKVNMENLFFAFRNSYSAFILQSSLNPQ